MSRLLFKLALSTLFFISLTPFISAEGGKQNVYTVIVGVSKYKDAQIKEKPKAEADAVALFKLLSDKNILGLTKENGKLLLGEPKNAKDLSDFTSEATRENVLEALKWAASKATPDDLVIFGFFGQGGPMGDSGDRRCYFTSDSTFLGRDKNAIASSDLADTLKTLKSGKFCSFIDVNFKGFQAAQGKAVAEASLGANPYQEFLGEDASEDHLPLPGRVVFLATNGLYPSIEAEDNGVFAKAVIEGLKGEADKEGYEADGVVTVDELAEFLDKKMPDLTKQYGKTKEEKNQLHWVLGGRTNHFILTHNPKEFAKANDRIEKFEKLVAAKKIPDELSSEGKLLLLKMPRLEAQRSLRKEYQSLVDGKIEPEVFEKKRIEILEQTKLSKDKADAFAKKVQQAIEVIRKGYVKEVNAGDMTAWAVKGLYRRIEEKIPDALQAKIKNPKDLREPDILKVLSDARIYLGKREDLDNGKDVDITLQRMLNNLDPYTTYIDGETKANFDRDVQGNFTGIGVQIRKDAVSEMLLVVTPIKNSPAYKAGVMAGDIISTVIREVDSEGKALPKPEVISTKGMQLSDAVKKILGKPNTKVKIIVQREGVEKPIEFEISRGRVEVETVLGFKRKDNDDWDFMIDPTSKIGYARVTSFSRNTARDLLKVMRELVSSGVKGFVLDLRFNPGGLLDSAVDISDLFIGDGLIVSIRPRQGREQKHTGVLDGSLLDFPMACLVNGGSASGSEIVSAAVQDHHRAIIIGERSYGKGSVQNIQAFGDGELKLTIASFWRPSGKNLNKSSTGGKDEDEWGVKPDLEIKLSRKERDDLMDHQRDIEVIQRKDKPAAKPVTKDFKDRQLDEAMKYIKGLLSTVSNEPSSKKAS